MAVPPPQGMDNYGNLQLPLLNPVRDATLAYGDWGDRSRLADLGLYQGRNIGPYVSRPICNCWNSAIFQRSQMAC
jgi:type VI secretion system protein ImpL